MPFLQKPFQLDFFCHPSNHVEYQFKRQFVENLSSSFVKRANSNTIFIALVCAGIGLIVFVIVLFLFIPAWTRETRFTWCRGDEKSTSEPDNQPRSQNRNQTSSISNEIQSKMIFSHLLASSQGLAIASSNNIESTLTSLSPIHHDNSRLSSRNMSIISQPNRLEQNSYLINSQGSLISFIPSPTNTANNNTTNNLHTHQTGSVSSSSTLTYTSNIPEEQIAYQHTAEHQRTVAPLGYDHDSNLNEYLPSSGGKDCISLEKFNRIAPRVKLEAVKEQLQEYGKDAECSVCVSQIKNSDSVRVLQCQHVFHAKCIEPWILKRVSKCPLCRYDLTV